MQVREHTFRRELATALPRPWVFVACICVVAAMGCLVEAYPLRWYLHSGWLMHFLDPFVRPAAWCGVLLAWHYLVRRGNACRDRNGTLLSPRRGQLLHGAAAGCAIALVLFPATMVSASYTYFYMLPRILMVFEPDRHTFPWLVLWPAFREATLHGLVSPIAVLLVARLFPRSIRSVTGVVESLLITTLLVGLAFRCAMHVMILCTARYSLPLPVFFPFDGGHAFAAKVDILMLEILVLLLLPIAIYLWKSAGHGSAGAGDEMVSPPGPDTGPGS
jgi:hypothetical protein